MRPFALTLAVFWSLQALVCLAPEIGSGAAGQAAGHEITATAHHHGDAEHGTGEREGAPHSHPPGPDHHQNSNGGCAQHCASLSQTVVASPATVPAPNVFATAIVPFAAFVDLPRALASALARLEFGRAPPDPLARNSTLRI